MSNWAQKQRERIQRLDPVTFFAKVARGEVDPTSAQMKAAELLLKRVLPEMVVPAEKPTELPNVSVNLGPTVENVDDWLRLIHEQRLPERDRPSGSDRRVVQLLNTRSA